MSAGLVLLSIVEVNPTARSAHVLSEPRQLLRCGAEIRHSRMPDALVLDAVAGRELRIEQIAATEDLGRQAMTERRAHSTW
jgi:hypothetical protein